MLWKQCTRIFLFFSVFQGQFFVVYCLHFSCCLLAVFCLFLAVHWLSLLLFIWKIRGRSHGFEIIKPKKLLSRGPLQPSPCLTLVSRSMWSLGKPRPWSTTVSTLSTPLSRSSSTTRTQSTTGESVSRSWNTSHHRKSLHTETVNRPFRWKCRPWYKLILLKIEKIALLQAHCIPQCW